MNRPPRHRFTVRDIVAGMSVALVLLPQAMAYAELAGMPPVHGLYAASLPLIAAALLASSPYLQTGPGALTALMTLGALLPLARPATTDYIGLAALLALVVGAARVAFGLLKGGWLSYLMSRPILLGFTSAAAVLILASQLPGALGVAPSDGSVLPRAWRAIARPAGWETASVLLSGATVVIVLGARRIHPLVPGVLVAALVGMAYSVTTGYAGPTVGVVSAGLPRLSLDLPWSSLPALIVPGTVIALVGFAEAASISRVFASEARERWDADREFLSQGAANLTAGLVGGFPVGGSFARSSLNRISGATSRWSGLVTGLTLLAFLPFADVVGPLPRAVLAGIVIAAVAGLVRPRELLALWTVSRPQAAVGLGTFVATLVLAPRIEQAVLLGVVSAAAVHMWRELTPGVEARVEGDTLHLEPSGVLWFGSAPALEDQLFARLAEEPETTRVIVHCGGLGRIDLTGAHTLLEMIQQVRKAGVHIRLVGVPEHAVRILSGVARSEGITFDPGPED